MIKMEALLLRSLATESRPRKKLVNVGRGRVLTPGGREKNKEKK